MEGIDLDPQEILAKAKEILAKAKENGASSWQIHKIREKFGLVGKPRKPVSPQKKGAIFRDFKTGLYNLEELAARHGVSAPTVSLILTKRLKRK